MCPRFLFSIVVLWALCSAVAAQQVTVRTPEPSKLTTSFADKLEDELDKEFRILDRDAAEAAIRSLKITTPFNLTSDQSKRIGELTDCSHVVIVNAASTRRTSSARPNYFEAYAALYLVNTRTGLLDQFILESKQGNTAVEAETSLNNAVESIARVISAKIKAPTPSDSIASFETYDPDSKTLRPAMPYKRIKPEYTQTAYLYGIAATVEAEVSIDTNGDVKRIAITRWAGYGLDESVIAAIRQMNWRPGERNGKPFPMSVLLRYNFTKVEKEQ